MFPIDIQSKTDYARKITLGELYFHAEIMQCILTKNEIVDYNRQTQLKNTSVGKFYETGIVNPIMYPVREGGIECLLKMVHE